MHNENVPAAVASIVAAAIQSGIVRTTADIATLTASLYRGMCAPEAVGNGEDHSRPARHDTGERAASWKPQVSGRAKDHIVCLECGDPFRSLGTPLRTHGLSPSEYRVKHGIPESVPLACADYSEQRRRIAERTVARSAIRRRCSL